MSLESQVLQLKAKHKMLDDAFQEFHQVVHGTQEVVSLILKEQREYYGKMEYRLEQLEHFAKQQDKRSDKMEELLVQIVNSLASK